MTKEWHAVPSLNHCYELFLFYMNAHCHTTSPVHTSTCKLSWTLSFSLRSRALFNSSTSLRTEAVCSWTRSSATSFSRFKRSIHMHTCTHIIKVLLELVSTCGDKKSRTHIDKELEVRIREQKKYTVPICEKAKKVKATFFFERNNTLAGVYFELLSNLTLYLLYWGLIHMATLTITALGHLEQTKTRW